MSVSSRPFRLVPALLAAALVAMPVAIASAANSTVRDLGRLSPNANVALVLGMRLRDTATLEALIAGQSDPRSPLYRHFLRPAQVRDAFGASRVDYARTLTVLRSHGFSITRVDPLRAIVDVSAPAGVVERYFATTLRAVATARANAYASVAPARIPAELSGSVEVVDGLKASLFATAYQAQVGYRKKSHASALAAFPAGSSTPQYGPDGGYGPQAIEGAFDFPSRHGIVGNGATVADLIDGTFSDKNDIAPYLFEFNVKRTGPKTTVRLVDGGCGTEDDCFDSFSAAVDAQNIIGTAPGVAYVVYELPSLSNVSIVDGLNAVVSDDAADIVNFGFGGCESVWGETSFLIDQAYALGSAEGITFETVTFGGSDPCGVPSQTTVQAPADSPHALTVGGADSFVDNHDNVTSAPIANSATGGGVSILFPLPSYQKGVQGVRPSGRSLPDIAGPDAINGVGPSVYVPSFGGWLGGTAFVNNAAIAGALAEVVQINGQRLGLVNTALYAAYKKHGYNGYNGTSFRDVTAGCNAGGDYGPFCAVKRFDLVSGIGVPEFYHLAKSL